MRHSKIIFSVCSLLTAYSAFGFSAPNVQPPPSDTAPKAAITGHVGPVVDTANLTSVIAKVQNDPATALTPAERTLLSRYAANSMAPAYSNLSMDQRSTLARVVYANAALFPRDTMTSFLNDQELQVVGFTSRESSDFNAIIVKIREGGSLNQNEVLLIQRLEPKIANFPAGLGPDLGKLVEYQTVNPGLFTQNDLNNFRSYCATAAGLTSADVQVLRNIASRRSTDINMNDQRVLLKFAANPLALNALNTEESAILGVVINDNQSMFPRGVVTTFNRNLGDNQAIQIKNSQSGFNARNLQGPNAIERNRNTQSPDMPTRLSPSRMQNEPGTTPRQLSRPNQ